MKLRKLVEIVSSADDAIIKPLGWVVGALIYLMVIVGIGNVVGRYCFNKPLLGTIELVELMMIVIVFFAIPYTQMVRGHVRVDVVIARFSRRNQVIMTSIACLLAAGLFAFITYQATVNAIYFAQHLDQNTSILFIPYAPFRAVMVLGCVLMCVKLLVHIFHPLPPEEGQEGAQGK